MAKAAARGEALPSDVFYHVIGTLAVRSPKGLQITNDSEGHRIVNLIMTEDSRAPITLFLQGYYHRSPSGILQRCISVAEGQELLREIHSGACGHHAAPRALVGNAFRQGFYWPTVVADATRIVRTYEGCQFYAR